MGKMELRDLQRCKAILTTLGILGSSVMENLMTPPPVTFGSSRPVFPGAT